MELEFFEKKMFSQNGEDGITMKLLELIYTENNDNKFYVEFGVQNGMECNTRILREYYNWKGLQMDGGNENNKFNLKKEFITKENVVELFKKYSVPQNINLLSVDIDFNDFYCLKEILANYQCDIIICEYNATHLANEDKIVIYKHPTNTYSVTIDVTKAIFKNHNIIFKDLKKSRNPLINHVISIGLKLPRINHTDGDVDVFLVNEYRG